MLVGFSREHKVTYCRYEVLSSLYGVSQQAPTRRVDELVETMTNERLLPL
jgi:hypothetical protein